MSRNRLAFGWGRDAVGMRTDRLQMTVRDSVGYKNALKLDFGDGCTTL